MKAQETGSPVKKILSVIVVAIIVITVSTAAVKIVPAGYRGVVLKFGAVQDKVLGEGLHIVTPFAESVELIEVRTQKYETDAAAASKDLLDVATTVAVNFHLDAGQVNDIYQTLGTEYEFRLIAPAVQETVKSIIAKFDAEGLIIQRETVKGQIETSLEERLSSRGIVVETISITNFQFPEQFNLAITDKQTAEQEALKAQNILKRIEIEAQQQIAQARGQAESIRIVTEEIKRNPQYLQWQAIQKWNGVLPLATSGNTLPFLNIPLTGNLSQ
jgi:regulator of protease activity HflC (stomatin/prohibitin superfamily)